MENLAFDIPDLEVAIVHCPDAYAGCSVNDAGVHFSKHIRLQGWSICLACSRLVKTVSTSRRILQSHVAEYLHRRLPA